MIERSKRYAKAIQTTTYEKQAAAIRGFCGYTVLYFGSQGGLAAYADAVKVASFVSYLQVCMGEVNAIPTASSFIASASS